MIKKHLNIKNVFYRFDNKVEINWSVYEWSFPLSFEVTEHSFYFRILCVSLIIPLNKKDLPPVLKDSVEKTKSITKFPFIINISNTTKNDIDGVVFLCANKEILKDSNFGNPEGIKISMNSNTISYRELLILMNEKPFVFTGFYLKTSNESQIYKPFLINSSIDSDGKIRTINYYPQRFLFSQIHKTSEVKGFYIADKNTKITTKILASTSLKVMLYPNENIDLLLNIIKNDRKR